MPSEHPPTASHPSILRAVRRHLAVVVWCVASGLVIGWLVAAAQPATYTSTAHVLINPTVGNPFAPAPTSVRQDELTSLETEAQVARSAEVLTAVASQNPPLTLSAVEAGVEITVPANTQILEMSYTGRDPIVAQQVADDLARAYLANRDRRATEVNDERIERVETQASSVVEDLRAATVAAQKGTGGGRLFQTELATALRNELVSLRAQRSYLENSEAPAGSVISPASAPGDTDNLTPLLMLIGGGLAGLALGCLFAALLERFFGRVRSAPEVEATGLQVLAVAPARGWRLRRRRATAAANLDTTIRRLRVKIMALEPAPGIISVAPVGSGGPEVVISEAIAESFAKAGHRVVLVRTEGSTATGGLAVEERGLSEALLHDRLRVVKMLQPSVEPLLCLLPWGLTAQSRELLTADRLRTVLMPLIEAGHLVVLQSPGIDSVEGEAVMGAADLGLVVVTAGRTRAREVEQIATHARTRSGTLGAVIVASQSLTGPGRHATSDIRPEHDHEPDRDGAGARAPVSRAPR